MLTCARNRNVLLVSRERGERNSSTFTRHSQRLPLFARRFASVANAMGGTHSISSRMWDEERTSCYLGESRGWPMVRCVENFTTSLYVIEFRILEMNSLYIYTDFQTVPSYLLLCCSFSPPLLLMMLLDRFPAKTCWCCMGCPPPLGLSPP